MSINIAFLMLAVGWMSVTNFDEDLYAVQRGLVRFKSEAPLEVIEASSKELKGLLNLNERTFAFTVDISSFQGFNSPLQKEHFNENYMETQIHKMATYAGKIIEDDDLSKDGTYSIRTKGKLTVHGVTKERIIKNEVMVKNGKIQVKSNFTVLLEEHAIPIPKVVYQKIAEEIQVYIEAEFVKKG